MPSYKAIDLSLNTEWIAGCVAEELMADQLVSQHNVRNMRGVV